MSFHDRTYKTIGAVDIGNINFDDLVNSEPTLRFNKANDEFIIEFDGTCPLDVQVCESAGEDLTYDQAKSLMQTVAWKDNTKVGDL